MKRTGVKKLGRKASHRKALVVSQVSAIFTHGKVVTTSPKAKVLKANVEAIISKILSEKNELALRKALSSVPGIERNYAKLVEFVRASQPKVSTVKIGFRAGDNAEKTRVEIMEFDKLKAAK